MKLNAPFVFDAHMHCWDQLSGMVKNDIPVTPLRNGRIRIGEEIVQGMPPTFLDCRATAERVLADWDANGVSGGVLVQEYLDGEQNAYSLQILAKYPGRFRAYALPDFFRTADTSAEAVALIQSGGFCGIKICGGHLEGKVQLDDSSLMPLYAYLDEHDLRLAVDFSEGEAQVAELERVLEKHPQLQVAVGHFGMPTRGGWPAQLQIARYPRVLIESGGIVWLYREQGTEFPDAIEAILHARDAVGIDKLMWGSDWPRTMCDFTYAQSLDFVRNSPSLSEEEKSAFLGGNAARFYGFPSPDPVLLSVPPITAG